MRLLLLAGLLLHPQGTPVEYTDVKFILPDGYRQVGTDVGATRIYRRLIDQEPGPEIRISVQPLSTRLDQKTPPRPHELVQQLGLPPKAEIVVGQETWRGFQVPSVEYRFEDRGGSKYFGTLILLPIELRTWVLQVIAPDSLEAEARSDLRKAATSAVGDTYWRKGGSIPQAIPIALYLIGGVLALVGWLVGVVRIYKSGERGLGCLSLIFSPVAIVYGLLHFDEMKGPCLTHLAGIALAGMAVVLDKYFG